MRSLIRHPKDSWTGMIFLLIDFAAVMIGRDYPMGSAGRMGPAYFPTILGSLLALTGMIRIVRYRATARSARPARPLPPRR